MAHREPPLVSTDMGEECRRFKPHCLLESLRQIERKDPCDIPPRKMLNDRTFNNMIGVNDGLCKAFIYRTYMKLRSLLQYCYNAISYKKYRKNQ